MRRGIWAPPYNVFSIEFCRAGPMRPAAKGADRSYISVYQRQRRRSRDDTTFNAPCKIPQTCGTHHNNLKRAGRAEEVQKPSGFWRRFLHTFCRCWQKVCRRRQNKSPSRSPCGRGILFSASALSGHAESAASPPGGRHPPRAGSPRGSAPRACDTAWRRPRASPPAPCAAGRGRARAPALRAR